MQIIARRVTDLTQTDPVLMQQLGDQIFRPGVWHILQNRVDIPSGECHWLTCEGDLLRIPLLRYACQAADAAGALGMGLQLGALASRYYAAGKIHTLYLPYGAALPSVDGERTVYCIGVAVRLRD